MKYKKRNNLVLNKFYLIIAVILLALAITNPLEQVDKTYEEVLKEYKSADIDSKAEIIIKANPVIRNKLISEIRGVKNIIGFDNKDLISDGTKIGNGKVWISLTTADFITPDSIEYDGKSLIHKFESSSNKATIKFDDGALLVPIGAKAFIEGGKYDQVEMQLDRELDITLENGKIIGIKKGDKPQAREIKYGKDKGKIIEGKPDISRYGIGYDFPDKKHPGQIELIEGSKTRAIVSNVRVNGPINEGTRTKVRIRRDILSDDDSALVAFDDEPIKNQDRYVQIGENKINMKGESITLDLGKNYDQINLLDENVDQVTIFNGEEAMIIYDNSMSLYPNIKDAKYEIKNLKIDGKESANLEKAYSGKQTISSKTGRIKLGEDVTKYHAFGFEIKTDHKKQEMRIHNGVKGIKITKANRMEIEKAIQFSTPLGLVSKTRRETMHSVKTFDKNNKLESWFVLYSEFGELTGATIIHADYKPWNSLRIYQLDGDEGLFYDIRKDD